MKHAAMIPLVGGAAIGASIALGRPPEYIASWPAFAANDHYCRSYYPDVPFHRVTDGFRAKRVDIVTCVPPCSGLSTATPSTARGCQAPQNEHMLIVADQAMERRTQGILIENAPALYSQAGEPLAQRFLPLCKKYGYSMVLTKTSSLLHGLPQNRVRSFVTLWRGKRIPTFQYIEEPYKPLGEWKVVEGPLSSDWSPNDDEMVQVMWDKLEQPFWEYTDEGPRSMWNMFNELRIKHRFKTKPYKYMQQTAETGAGIMDRSPIVVTDYSNALMWKSAHKMLNPATDYQRQFSIRELMSLMGLPRDFSLIPRKDINVLFQNVPVNTVATMVTEMANALDGKRKWVKPTNTITRINNIKQTTESW